MAYQSCDVIETMKQDTGIDIPTLKVDGGAVNRYLMQFQADILHASPTPGFETTALVRILAD